MMDCVLLSEVAEALQAQRAGAGIRCVPTVEADDDRGIVLTLTFDPAAQDDAAVSLAALEVYNRLRYLCGLGAVRAFASEYGIDSAQLEALLPDQET